MKKNRVMIYGIAMEKKKLKRIAILLAMAFSFALNN